MQTYTNQTYVVTKVKKRTPTYMYDISTKDGKAVEGSFYGVQMVKVSQHEDENV